jgi:hypothetical protein
MKAQRTTPGRLAAAAAIALGCAAALPAADSPPISVVTFDREFTNWANTIERRFDFPPADIPVKKIVLTIALDCPSGGCDPWDRGATVFVRGRNPAGQMDKYEIARFITPYGMGCSWEVDVTDYRIFLAGSASLGFFIETWINGDRGWLVTLRFDFYPGIPDREVAGIENLWHGKPEYGNPDNPIANFFAEKSVTVDPSATAAKLRFFVTGHGQGNTDNAAEFARKLHRVHVNEDSFEHHLWRDDCDANPCSPQGGTWQYDRAGWCPGSAAAPWDVDISDAVVPGEAAAVRFEVEAYTNRCRPSATCVSSDCPFGNCDYDSNGHTQPIYWVESQAISYRPSLGGGGYFVFQRGLDGYAGAADTMLLEASPASSRAAATVLSVDADAGGGKATQALLRFDGIFGDGAGQIPFGTPIRLARLEFTTTDPGSGAAAHRLRAAWSDADTWAAFGGDGIVAGIEALPEPDGAASATAGGVVSIDVTAGVSAWSAGGCPYFGWALLPTGADAWGFSSSEGADPPRLVVLTRAPIDDPLVLAGDEWRYWKGTAAPPAGWKGSGFVPGAGWLTGRTGIGYEDGDDLTVLADMEGEFPSVFCRREFLAGPLVTALRLRIDYDDGFAAYLNGVEVARSTSLAAPGAALAWNMLARSGREAGTAEVYDIPTSRLVPGTNVLAVQVHNNALDSSDLSLIPELLADSVLVPPGADWRFLRGEPLPASWTRPDFDDSSWEAGPAGIGYGDGDDRTRLLDMEDSYRAVFCRKAFDIDGLDRLGGAALRVIYDDGIVAFANGTEIGRLNMPAGTVTASLLASSAVEPMLGVLPIPAGLLVEGRNVIAVSVHNAALDSSDLSFDPVVVPVARADSAGCGSAFRRGDGNDDGTVDLSDAVFVLGFLFLGGAEPVCQDACDSTDDGRLDISDGILILGALFLGQGPIPPPGTADCGLDPTDDPLGCEGSSGCR